MAEINHDMEDSENGSIAQLNYENSSITVPVWFYKCHSYFKEQKARIVIERNTISLLCINSVTEEVSENGFKTYAGMLSNNLANAKLNYDENGSTQLKLLDNPVIDIDEDLEFLQDEIYLVSFKELNEDNINNDDIYFIESTVNEVPNLKKAMVDYDAQNNSNNNKLNLNSITNYNATRINSISVNFVNPISIKDIKTDGNNNLLFNIDIDKIAISNIQLFTKIKGIDSNVSEYKSNIISLHKYSLDNFSIALPIKLNFTEVDKKLSFNNSWLENVLNWDTAKTFIEQQDLEDLLTIKEIPDIETVYNYVKFKDINVKGKIIINGAENYDAETTINNNINILPPETANLLGVDSNPVLIKYLNKDTESKLDDEFFIKELFNVEKTKATVINQEGKEIPITNIEFNQALYFDLKIYMGSTLLDTFIDYPLTNISFDDSFLDGKNTLTPTAHLKMTPTDKSLKSIDKTYAGEQSGILYFNVAVNPDRVYKRLKTQNKPTEDKFLLLKLLKLLLKYIVNYRDKFQGATYEDNDVNRPKNECAKLKQQFFIWGSNPIENINNIINDFTMKNPWIVKIPEWDYLIKVIAMCSRYTYSTYSLNTGLKAEEELTLPWYFDFLTPAIKINDGDGYIYDFVSLQVKLNSKYFDFNAYDDNSFTSEMFNKLPPLSNKLTVENNYIKVIYPFLSSKITEQNLNIDPYYIDITKEEFQKYILYFLFSFQNYKITNRQFFDCYMDTLFQSNNNYSEIYENYLKLINCVSNGVIKVINTDGQFVIEGVIYMNEFTIENTDNQLDFEVIGVENGK